jgi:hypothetical protein
LLNNLLPGADYVESIDGFTIGNFSCGYKLESPNGMGSTIEINKNFSSYNSNFSSYNSHKHQLFETKEPTSTSIHGGVFRSFENSRMGFGNSITLRGGFMIKQINYDTYSVQDNAITVGLGLIFLNNTNEIDISVSSGIRKTEYEFYPDEKYINVNFGISSGDIWFKKMRRK